MHFPLFTAWPESTKLWYSRRVFQLFAFNSAFQHDFVHHDVVFLIKLLPILTLFARKLFCLVFLRKICVSSSFNTYLGSITKDLWIIKWSNCVIFYVCISLYFFMLFRHVRDSNLNRIECTLNALSTMPIVDTQA